MNRIKWIDSNTKIVNYKTKLWDGQIMKTKFAKTPELNFTAFLLEVRDIMEIFIQQLQNMHSCQQQVENFQE